MEVGGVGIKAAGDGREKKHYKAELILKDSEVFKLSSCFYVVV